MSDLAAFADEEFEAFREFVRRSAGLQFDASRREALRLAVRTRVLACGDGTFQAYLDRLRGPGREAELTRLLELLTIQETCFFRNPEHFRALAEAVLPHLPGRPTGRLIRIWSAGCATGEEAYSIALTLLETGLSSAEVLGTDVSEAALEGARTGRYSRRALRLVAGPLLDRYFRREGEHFLVGEEVRRLVRFEHLNLIQEPFPTARFSGWDVIFCRNVIIYLAPESVRRLIRIFTECLAPGRVLFLGPSETLWQLSTDFELAEWAGGFYYRRRAPAPFPVPASPPPAGDTGHLPRAPQSRRARRRVAPPEPPIQTGLERALEAIRSGDVVGAEAVLEASVGEEDPEAVPLVLLGYLRLSGGKLEAATDLTRRALGLDPLCPDAHILEGLIAREEERDEAALAAFRRAIYLEPGAALARYQLGQLYALRGERERAHHEFAETIRLLNAGAASSVLTAAYPVESLRHACRLTWERSRSVHQV